MKQYIEAGEFVTTHGILGEIKLYPWCDGPEFLCNLKKLYLDDNGKKSLEIESIRPHKAMCLIKFEGINSPEAARIYIGKTAYLNRDDVQLEEGAYFVQDVIGCVVKDAKTGEIYGEVVDVSHPGAHDIYTILNKQTNQQHLFPVVDEFMQSSNPHEKLILINPIKGMFTSEAINDDED